MGHLELPDADGVVPTVFLSYRRGDRAVVVELADRLRSDLGPRNVFRDEDDLIGGQDWRAELDRRIAAATSILVIIGENWEGAGGDGGRRIDDPDDVVRAEVQRSLEAGAHGTPTPVLVDRGIPDELPEALAPLGDIQAVSVTSTELDSESDYPRVLAAVWYSLSKSVPNGVVIVAGRNAELRLAEFVRSVNEADLIDARFLSRFGANMCVISARQADRRAPHLVAAGAGSSCPNGSSPNKLSTGDHVSNSGPEATELMPCQPTFGASLTGTWRAAGRTS